MYDQKESGFQLVSWASEARSRREDELARHRELEAAQQTLATPVDA
ncbi:MULTISPECIES: hypothetical protein [Dyella]|nr:MULTISPECIES: hypothetical protein [Dyella]